MTTHHDDYDRCWCSSNGECRYCERMEAQAEEGEE